MDTSALKRFATQARIKLKDGVRTKLRELGFDDNGHAATQPRLVRGATLYNNAYYEESFYHQWWALDRAIQTYGVQGVLEEAAYTWFNRFMAIRILQKNGFIQPVLSFDNPDIRVPHIVSEARQGRYPALDEEERMRLLALIGDATKTYEQFALLIIAFCHHTPIICRCFGLLTDYTELLLPRDVLHREGFLDMLNHTPFIADEDYKTTELLGWLYQFYISDCKDEVYAKFKKGKKAEAEDIAPATQIFTPNWIVKYMVQNTLGRIYLDNNPGSPLEKEMKYLVAPSTPTPDDAVLHYVDLDELTVMDPACGSGHILLEAFDLLYAMYLKAFYTRQETVEHIFRYNLTGIDIDTRAKQLATFALLLKACQKDASFLDAHIMPCILDMPPKVDVYTWKEKGRRMEICLSVSRQASQTEYKEICNAFELMSHADNLGSIMKFELSDSTREYMQAYVDEFEREPKFEDDFLPVIASFRVMLALTKKYAAVITNPPYMGSGNMNIELSMYVKDNYADGKADFFSTFMLIALDHLVEKGKCGMITMQSWMFLSSFEKLRKSILDNYHIENMLHLGPRTFDELSGEVVQNVAFVIGKAQSANGIYYRLIDGKDCADKERMFISKEECYPNVSQQNFEKIPGRPIGYWLSEKMIKLFNGTIINDYCYAGIGMRTGDNIRFLRLWHEISKNKFTYFKTNAKWVPYNKGGEFRKWYGNNYNVVNWENNGYEIKENTKLVYPQLGDNLAWKITNEAYYFIPGITWTGVSSKKFNCRMYGKGFIFDSGANGLFPNEGVDMNLVLGYLNCKIANNSLQVLNPTINYGAGTVRNIPFLQIDNEIISNTSHQCYQISKQDWDAHETSWDFEENELLALNNADTYIDVMQEYGDFYGMYVDLAPLQLGNLEWLVSIYKTKWETKFLQLHKNEEELNRQFIAIYGLEEELTPDVPYSEITILQQGEISIEQD